MATTTAYTLYIQVLDSQLAQRYAMSVEKHNQKLLSNSMPDSGFDLFSDAHYAIDAETGLLKIDHLVRGAMQNNKTGQYSGYYMYSRSSIYKTPFRLANNTGVIDAGYRGHLIGMFDINKFDEGAILHYNACIKNADRLVQICSPTLEAFNVVIVDVLDTATERGEGGFGSTNTTTTTAV
jgi:dUTPase